MAEVLSQSEIDALLSALSTGDVEPEQLKEKEEKQKIKNMTSEVLRSFLRIT